MGIFSNSSSFDDDVDKATREDNTTEDWGTIMEICDKVGSSQVTSQDCLRSIIRRLYNSDPHIVVQAITLLNACVSNCPRAFKLEVASRDFENEYRRILSKCSREIKERLLLMLRQWAEGEFKSDPELGLIPALYDKLKKEGVKFPSIKDEAYANKKKEDYLEQESEELARAIALSLQVSENRPSSSTMYPSLSSASQENVKVTKKPRLVRALYDFEAAEDNELTFHVGDFIEVIDDTDSGWWKGKMPTGEGLFPSNFVTSNLSEVTAKKEISENEINEKLKKEAALPTQPVVIDEEKINRLLHILHEASPIDGSNDPPELHALETEVNAMWPLIDAQMEKIDRRHAQLTAVSTSLVDGLNLYHTLMREEPAAYQPHYNQANPQHYMRQMPPMMYSAPSPMGVQQPPGLMGPQLHQYSNEEPTYGARPSMGGTVSHHHYADEEQQYASLPAHHWQSTSVDESHQARPMPPNSLMYQSRGMDAAQYGHGQYMTIPVSNEAPTSLSNQPNNMPINQRHYYHTPQQPQGGNF